MFVNIGQYYYRGAYGTRGKYERFGGPKWKSLSKVEWFELFKKRFR